MPDATSASCLFCYNIYYYDYSYNNNYLARKSRKLDYTPVVKFAAQYYYLCITHIFDWYLLHPDYDYAKCLFTFSDNSRHIARHNTDGKQHYQQQHCTEQTELTAHCTFHLAEYLTNKNKQHNPNIRDEPAINSDILVTNIAHADVVQATCGGYFLEKIKHQGLAPYAGSNDYVVFRNVKDFGAVGDGVHDDTEAINRAISRLNKSPDSGGRCEPGKCKSTTKTPAVVYFPGGTYLVSEAIIDDYFTQLIGDPNCMPTIKVAPNFRGPYVIDGDSYHAWQSVSIFWRQVRNFVIDMTGVSPDKVLTGVHWPTGQATSLQNIVFHMSSAANTRHQGVYSEDGSGGFLGDLTFNGGENGLNFGNQQYTMRNLVFNGCKTAIRQIWDWTWTYKSLHINNCSVGLDLSAGAPGKVGVAAVVVVDSVFNNVETAIVTGRAAGNEPVGAGQLVLEWVEFYNVQNAIKDSNGNVVEGPVSAFAFYASGLAYHAKQRLDIHASSESAGTHDSNLLGANGRYYERSKPQYGELPISAFLSVRDLGAKGDGVTDDTAAVQKAIDEASRQNKVLFVDYGLYVVTDTIRVPSGARIVGEGYPVILSAGSRFNDIDSPVVVMKVGGGGGDENAGTTELSDLIVSTRGAQAGAVLIEWNVAGTAARRHGMWDVHTRIGGFAGSQLQLSDCPLQAKNVVTSSSLNKNCVAAYMSLHITPQASFAYMENVWFWVADHDIEDQDLTMITVYAGRGVLIEGSSILLNGPASEHHVLYQFHLHNARNVAMGLIQTETAYYQPNPDATIPFSPNKALADPVMQPGQLGWGALYSGHTERVVVYGAGHYSFFNNNAQTCGTTGCQKSIVRIEDPAKVLIYGLATTGTTYMIDEGGATFANASAPESLASIMGTMAIYTNQ